MAQDSGPDGQPNQQNTPATPQPQQIDPATLQALLDNQRLEAQNKATELRLREKEIDGNLNYSHSVLNHQAGILNNRPNEERKTLWTVASIVLLSAVLLMAFIIYCLYVGEREFIYKLLRGLGYLVTTGLGWLFGRNSKTPGSNSSDSPGAEVVE